MCLRNQGPFFNFPREYKVPPFDLKHSKMHFPDLYLFRKTVRLQTHFTPHQATVYRHVLDGIYDSMSMLREVDRCERSSRLYAEPSWLQSLTGIDRV